MKPGPHNCSESRPNDCGVCWLWEHRPEDARRAWGAEAAAPKPEPPLPSVLRQAANLAQAAAAHVASGLAQASPEEQHRRQALCLACEHYRPSDGRCSKCGCGCKTKSAWQSSSCPVGKW